MSAIELRLTGQSQITVPGEVILVVENDVQPLGGRDFAPNPAVLACSVPQTLAGREGALCRSPKPVPPRPFGPKLWLFGPCIGMPHCTRLVIYGLELCRWSVGQLTLRISVRQNDLTERLGD